MTSSTLIRLLKAFTPSEIKKFEDYVKSPFFNKNTLLISLFELIKDHYPLFDSQQIEKTVVFERLYPGREYKDSVMRNLMSELLRLCVGFLKVTNYDEHNSNIDLMRILSRRNVVTLYEKSVKTAETGLAGQSKNDLYFLNMLYFETVKMNHNIASNVRQEKIDNPLIANEYLISFFLIRYFRINYNLLIQKYNFNFASSVSFIDELIRYVESEPFQSRPLILIYYNMFMTRAKPEDRKYYDNLKELLKKNPGITDRIESFNMYAALQNYCMFQIQKGNEKYYEEIFEVYVEMLDKEIYSYDITTYMPIQLFRNIVNTSARLGKFDWAERFISNYLKAINPDFKQNVLNYSLSNLYFHKKNFEKALEHLSLVKYDSVLDKPLVKVILLEIYYEMGLFEEIESQVDSNKHFINNDKLISSERKSLFSNFIYFIGRLMRLKDKTDNLPELSKLKDELNGKEVLEKEWLIQKFSGLISARMYKKGAS